MIAMKIERYFENAEIRASTSEGNRQVVSGHPAVFNQETRIGEYFREIIEPDAFANADMSNVFLFANHKIEIPLARSSANKESTMALSVDEKGLFMRATLDTANNVDAKKLYSAVQRGDVSGMSFAFSVNDEEWKDLKTDLPLRIIRSISKVYEVSVVTFPAYETTDVQARSILEAARTHRLPSDESEEYRQRIGILGGIRL